MIIIIIIKIYFDAVPFLVKFALGLDNFGAFNFGWSRNERLHKLRYRMHNCHVLQTIPNDILLIHRSPEGWPPLCKYLEKDVPSIPYPHQNKNAALFTTDMMKSTIMSRMVKEMIVIVSCLILLTAVTLYWYFLS